MKKSSDSGVLPGIVSVDAGKAKNEYKPKQNGVKGMPSGQINPFVNAGNGKPKKDGYDGL